MDKKSALRAARRAGKAMLPRRYRPAVLQIYRPVAALLLAGDNVSCPCCGRSFRRFLPAFSAHGRNRPNALCPRCGSGERHRLLWLYFDKELDALTRDVNFLHFAPEWFFQRKFRSLPTVRYVSTDLDSPLADVHADITRLPFEDRQFDVTLCSHVLEHVPDDRAAMRELWRVLRPGGRAVVMTPIDSRREETFEDLTVQTPAERARLFGQDDHVRIYGRDLKDRLEEAGFAVQVDRYAVRLGEHLIKKHALRADHEIYLCTKPVG